MGPRCPYCQTRIPFMKTQWALGSSFACRGCASALVVPRSQSAALGLLLLTAFWIFRHQFPPQWGGQLGLLVAFCVIGLPSTWALTKAKSAPANIKEKPPEN